MPAGISNAVTTGKATIIFGPSCISIPREIYAKLHTSNEKSQIFNPVFLRSNDEIIRSEKNRHCRFPNIRFEKESNLRLYIDNANKIEKITIKATVKCGLIDSILSL